MFAPSSECVACHNNLVTSSGEDVSIGATWRGTMMANSARDPYVLASVRRETIDHPSRAADIEDECAACHMPAAQKIAHAHGGKAEVFAHFANADAAARGHRRAGARRRHLHGLPSDRARPARHARQLQRQLRRRRAATRRHAPGLRAARRRRRAAANHALGDRLRAGRGAAHPRVGAVRDLPHADHRGARPRRPGDRLAARADELSGVAAQRVLPGGAQLPVVPHATGAGTRPRRVGARRRSRRACRATRSSAATPSCCG